MYGVDGDTGKVTDMKEYGLLESASVKIQTLKTAIEVSAHPARVPQCRNHDRADICFFFKSATLLLRVDDIVSARRPEEGGGGGGGGVQTMGEMGEDGPPEGP